MSRKFSLIIAVAAVSLLSMGKGAYAESGMLDPTLDPFGNKLVLQLGKPSPDHKVDYTKLGKVHICKETFLDGESGKNRRVTTITHQDGRKTIYSEFPGEKAKIGKITHDVLVTVDGESGQLIKMVTSNRYGKITEKTQFVKNNPKLPVVGIKNPIAVEPKAPTVDGNAIKHPISVEPKAPVVDGHEIKHLISVEPKAPVVDGNAIKHLISVEPKAPVVDGNAIKHPISVEPIFECSVPNHPIASGSAKPQDNIIHRVGVEKRSQLNQSLKVKPVKIK